MIVRLIGGLLLLLVCLFPKYAFAGYATAEQLLTSCTNTSNEKDPVRTIVNPFHCLGYIDGVIDAHELLSAAHLEAKYFCLPPTGLEAGDAMDIVLKYIRDNPSMMTMPARLVIIRALNEKYPCKK